MLRQVSCHSQNPGLIVLPAVPVMITSLPTTDGSTPFAIRRPSLPVFAIRTRCGVKLRQIRPERVGFAGFDIVNTT
jgi:hypothetical protein